jgi:hypothetical protein
MRADEPYETSAFPAADTIAFGQTAPHDPLIDDHAAARTNARPISGDATHVRQDLDPDESQPAARGAPGHPVSRRWGVMVLALAATLGGVVALTSPGGHAGKPRPASASIARHPATSALSASANKPSTHKATSGHTARAHRRSRARHRRHSAPHAHVPAASHHSTFVSQATVNSGAIDTPSAASRDSQTHAPATTVTPQPSPATTTPVASTHASSSSSSTSTSTSSSTSSRPKFGQQGVLGPGHSPDS